MRQIVRKAQDLVARTRRASLAAAAKQLLTPDTPKAPATMVTVLEDELQEIQLRRRRQYQSDQEGASSVRLSESLVGLALSGGGIRSATFSLGVLQGLEALKLLRVFDYVSTVSGGGFVGGWWSAWLSRYVFNGSHITDPLRLADELQAIARQRALLAEARRDAGATTTASKLRIARRVLIDLLIQELNYLADQPDLRVILWGKSASVAEDMGVEETSRIARRKQNYNMLIEKYSDALQDPVPPMVFPAPEQIEQERADRYRNDRIPDGALAAGIDPIHHLRLFSNYLTPRKGLASADTWRAIGVFTRNLALTWLVLIPILLGTILLGQLYFVGLDPSMLEQMGDHLPSPEVLLQRVKVAAPLIIVPIVWLIFLTVLWMRFNNAGTASTRGATWVVVILMTMGLVLGVQEVRGVCDSIRDCLYGTIADPNSHIRDPLVGLAFAVGVVGALFLLFKVVRISGARILQLKTSRERQIQSNQATRWQGIVLRLWVFLTMSLVFAGFAHYAVDALIVGGPRLTLNRIVAGLGAIVSLSGAIFTAIKASPVGGAESRAVDIPGRVSQVVFALTPLLMLLLLMTSGAWVTQEMLSLFGAPGGAEVRLTTLTIEVFLGMGLCLVFAGYEAGERRGARSTMTMTICMMAAAAALYLVLRGLVFEEQASSVFSWAVGSGGVWWAFGAQLLGWATVLATTLVWQRGRNGRLLYLGGFAVVALLSLLFIATRLTEAFFSNESDISRWYGLYAGVGLGTFLGSWAVALGWMADPNALSLHTFYRSRLVRAYLGASNWNRNRETKKITDAVEGDDILLSELENCARGGPYHLVNTTLNLVGGRDLTTAQRSAASFLMSKLYCGSVRTGYRRTEEYMQNAMTLGAAVAASGAAISPNMGSRTPTAALAMLLTLMNVRLGFWTPSPHRQHWRQPQTRLWPWYLLKESLSQTNAVSSYCYLTDGGHFDNTGLYSLVERGCRFIVLVDNGADTEPCFRDLGEAMRRCRIDFGAEIELDVSGFRKTDGFTVEFPSEGSTAAIRRNSGTAGSKHWVIGRITYSEAHAAHLEWQGSDRTGVIVWLKPALVAHEPADVRQYGFENPVFPQQTTADQWFDEAQFESYRKLGFFSAMSAFKPTLTQLGSDKATFLVDGTLTAKEVETLFRSLESPVSVSLPGTAFHESRP
jgi:hypothetical protein